MDKKTYYISINEVKQLMTRCTKEFDTILREEELDKDVIKLCNNSIKYYKNTVVKLLDRLQDYKRKENKK